MSSLLSRRTDATLSDHRTPDPVARQLPAGGLPWLRHAIGRLGMAGLFILFVFLLVACGGSSGGPSGSATGQLSTETSAATSDAQLPAGDVELGAALYAENCVACHGGETGGTIRDVPPPHNGNGHTWHHGDCVLTDITLRGAAAWGADPASSAMPAFAGQLTEQEVIAIFDYVKTWWDDEQRAYQAEVTDASCPGP